MDPKPSPTVIPREILEDAYREARRSFPAECCGWLAGTRDGAAVTAVRRCVNAQAQGGHPTTPARGAEDAYVIAGDDLLALSRSFDGETPARVIYHSHSNGGAYLAATSPWGDGPVYPVQQLVIGIDGEKVTEAALFAWSDDEGGFAEIARYEGAAI